MITCITRHHDSRSDSALYSMRVTTKVSIYNCEIVQLALIRVKDITSNGITSKLTMLPESGEFDEWVNVTLTKKQTNEVKANLQKY